MKTIILGGLLAAATTGAFAQSAIFKCTNKNGTVEYTNIGDNKGCVKPNLENTTIIPAPASVKKAQAQQTASAKQASSPADFPKVDSSTQKARDTDRKQILLDEMRAEEQKLAGLKKEFNNGEPERRGDERNYAKYQERVALMKQDIERSEKNIEALKRELGNMK
ncbi:DUF4124 domain-containing protein [Noviherbaspirillum galbum]|uniref:DUF4124 domain-containing protein n=1 Tax=Noviherbaspirillum galbum TaxID=2709383 RepID=A0A6B3SMG1_9BURK|nr:DUF4124 domain-containing protein [Noviherbaspirillum galbum]NEX62044.1 DUF4124 domain-containing protein [Noviherbaspirillum galbum]